MADRALEDIINEYIYGLDLVTDNVHIDCAKHWTTDDLIELGVIINKILRERSDG